MRIYTVEKYKNFKIIIFTFSSVSERIGYTIKKMRESIGYPEHVMENMYPSEVLFYAKKKVDELCQKNQLRDH